MLREKLVFGPIFSRRLGSSLGINLLPEEGKLCNFDCIYCECGWNEDGRNDRRLPAAEDLRRELDAKLSECRAGGVKIDSITFSGDGEPTINPQFPQMIDITLKLRDLYYPECVVSVLSNATMAGRPEIREALMKVDNPILKLDAPTNALAWHINRPSPGYDVERTVAALEEFKGNFVLQTMFLRSPDFDSSSPEVLGPWMDIVRRLRPREVMAYTIDRETPMKGLERFSADEMAALLELLIKEGFKIQIKG